MHQSILQYQMVKLQAKDKKMKQEKEMKSLFANYKIKQVEDKW